MTDRLLVTLERLSHVLREDLRASATAHGLPLAQFSVLRYLSLANRFSNTLKDVVAYLGATKGTTSQTVRALEAKGLLRRERDPKDGRVAHLLLTAEGRQVVEAALPTSWKRDHDEGVMNALQSLLQGMLEQRGGMAFDACHTCRFHEARQDGLWCGLLETPLTPQDARAWCREHVAP